MFSDVGRGPEDSTLHCGCTGNVEIAVRAHVGEVDCIA